MSTIRLGEKRVKILLQTIDQAFQILHDRGILEYADLIE